MNSIPANIRGRVAALEQYSGWLSLCFAATMAIANPHAVLWRIAEHSTARGLWVVGFALLGLCLVIAPHWHVRRFRFLVAVFAAVHWSFFGCQAWMVGAVGATLLSVVVVGHLAYVAEYLFRRGWE